MNNTTRELNNPMTAHSTNSSPNHEADELHTLKRDLLKAEVVLAKARASAVTAEIDIKVLTARLKALTK